MKDKLMTSLPMPVSCEGIRFHNGRVSQRYALISLRLKKLIPLFKRVLAAPQSDYVPAHLREDMGLPPAQVKVVIRHHFWQL
ncbi:MAG: hypothetical protein JKX94_05730 [Sneathiella sp.]|nr:hypothetical protein [Sneathiella sp.]